MGVKELLFVRERKNDNITGKAAPYSFIGLADYNKQNKFVPLTNCKWDFLRLSLWQALFFCKKFLKQT